MSDSETPEHNRERDGAPPSSGSGPVGNPPAPAPAPVTAQPSGIPPLSAPAPQGAPNDPKAPPPGSRGDVFAGVRNLFKGRRPVWVAVAVLCVAVGTVASVLGAHAVARTDATKARQEFPRTSSEIASELKLDIQHEEDLVIGASTFFAANPNASAAEFAVWVKWAQALRRYPELERLGLVTLVRTSELAAFEQRTTGHAAKPPVAAVKPLGSHSPQSAGAGPQTAVAGLHIVPAGKRSFNCLAAVELSRSPVRHTPASLDYCALTPGLVASRDSALSVYTAAAVGHDHGLVVQTPVYRGNLPPSNFTARRGAFAGWLREVLLPGVVLGEVLRDHPQYAIHLRYKSGPSQVVFTSGAPQAGAQTATANLHDGWTLRTFGPPLPGAGIFEDGGAVALLITGILLSALLGLLVLVLAGRRSPAKASEPGEPSHGDLYDPLTGLPNRALMMDRADRMIARAKRQSGLLVGALFIDIDWFKDVNEKLGQPAGDQLLAVVGERLEGVVRVHDTVGRLGGDEFVVLVESAARGVRLDALARRVIEALNKPVELDGFGMSLSLTASIGVAFGRYATPEDLLRDAQLALTAAKAAGRNRYTLFNANMRSVIEGRGVLGVELNAAVQDKQFFLLYEPIFDMSTHKLVELEANIRWMHPTQRVLPPDDFIPLAEESGLIVPIGRWMMEEACTRAAAWNVAGHQVGISVKVSAHQLSREGFLTDVQRALQQSGIEPSLLTLEIAETAVMRDVAASAERLRAIKQLGVRIAIGDFGSGYAHHSDLRQMPLDFLKVDRNTLAMSDDEDYRNWLLQAILIVGRDLSLPVIATGVETFEQLSSLHEMGCRMAQGQLLGKPTPVENLEGIFAAGFPAASETSAEASTKPVG